MMLPNVRQSCVIYVRFYNPISNLICPVRRILTNTFVSEQGNTIARETGIVLDKSTFIQCFSEPDLQYVPLHEWEELAEDELAGKWSVELGTTSSIIVDHIVDYEFNFATLTQITTLENAFVNYTPGAKRVAEVSDNRHGSKRVRHIELRA